MRAPAKGADLTAFAKATASLAEAPTARRRKVVDRAKGILQRDLGLTEEEAYLTIQRQSRQRRKSKKEISEAIILGDELRKTKS